MPQYTIDTDKMLVSVREYWKKAKSKLRLSDNEAAGGYTGYKKTARLAIGAFLFILLYELIAPNAHNFDYVTHARGLQLSSLVNYVLVGAIGIGTAIWASYGGKLLANAPERVTKDQLIKQSVAGIRDEVVCRLLLIPVALFCYWLALSLSDSCVGLPVSGALFALAFYFYFGSLTVREQEKKLLRRAWAKYTALAGAALAAAYFFVSNEVPWAFNELVIPVADSLANVITLGNTRNVLTESGQPTEMIAAALIASAFSNDTAKYQRGSAQHLFSKLALAPVWVGILFNVGFLGVMVVRTLYEATFVVSLWVLRMWRDDELKWPWPPTDSTPKSP